MLVEKLTDGMFPKKNQIQKQQNKLKPTWQRVMIAGLYDGIKMSLIDWLIKSGERLFEAINVENLTQSSSLLWKILLGLDGIGSFIQRAGSNALVSTRNRISGKLSSAEWRCTKCIHFVHLQHIFF